MDTILITGAAGFIGSHCAEAWLSKGARVVGLDNFDPFYDRALKKRNLDEIARRFPSHPATRVPQLESDVYGMAALDRISRVLFQ